MISSSGTLLIDMNHTIFYLFLFQYFVRKNTFLRFIYKKVLKKTTFLKKITIFAVSK